MPGPTLLPPPDHGGGEPASGPVAVLGGAVRALAELDATAWTACPEDDLVHAVEQLELLRCQVAAQQARVLAEIDSRGLAKERGWGSTADWLTHVAGLRRGQGRRQVEQALELTSDRAGTLDALARGAVSPEQVDVVLEAVDRLPGDPALREAGERLLLAEAGQVDATTLARSGRHLVHTLDSDGSAQAREAALDRIDRAAHRGRRLTIMQDAAGGVRLTGHGSAEDGALLRSALLALAAPPVASDDDVPEPDAPRDHGARMWDALVAVAEQALAADLPPRTHGARPRIAVTVDYDTLRGSLEELDSTCLVSEDGTELTPATVRRLACDAEILPVVLGGPGIVLDVGRVQRTCPPALWLALVVRDQHCTFPGCTRPPVMCHAHHVVPWAEHGPTSLGNLALLCGHHHRVIHTTGWQLRISPDDGRPEVLPPASPVRPEPEWIRHRPRRE